MNTHRLILTPSRLRGLALLTLALLIAIGALSNAQPRTVHAASPSVVGVWFVNAVGAPFQPHLATFHPDGTMIIDNPEAGDTSTSDSAGMGPWQVDQNNNHLIDGKFEEINANRTTGAYVSFLIVTFTITVTGNTFTGPAQATYYNPDGTLLQGPFPATLNGTLLTLP